MASKGKGYPWPKSKRTTLEYKVMESKPIHWGYQDKALLDLLHREAKSGWELVQSEMSGGKRPFYRVILKRAVPHD